ncbi:MAG: hypothetical protein Q8N18_20135 [Opitutaceae bacterium]|nr:hypothetical protein [Opitutaceae bacterium]
MTTTDKAVQRVTRAPYMVLFPNSRAKARAIVVAIGPGDLLRFREKGRRTWFDLPLEAAFGMAVKCAAEFRLCFVPGKKTRPENATERSAARR